MTSACDDLLGTPQTSTVDPANVCGWRVFGKTNFVSIKHTFIIPKCRSAKNRLLNISCWQLNIMSCQINIWSCQLDILSYELDMLSSQLDIMSCELNISSCKLNISSYDNLIELTTRYYELSTQYTELSQLIRSSCHNSIYWVVESI